MKINKNLWRCLAEQQRVYGHHADGTLSEATGAWQPCLHNLCWISRWWGWVVWLLLPYNSFSSPASAHVVQAWLSHTCCFRRCSKTKCPHHNNHLQSRWMPLISQPLRICRGVMRTARAQALHLCGPGEQPQQLVLLSRGEPPVSTVTCKRQSLKINGNPRKSM